MTTLSPLIIMIPSLFDCPFCRTSSAPSRTRFMCWSYPCSCPLRSLPFRSLTSTVPRSDFPRILREMSTAKRLRFTSPSSTFKPSDHSPLTSSACLLAHRLIREGFITAEVWLLCKSCGSTLTYRSIAGSRGPPHLGCGLMRSCIMQG